METRKLNLPQVITMRSNQQAPGTVRDVVSKDNVENNLERHSISTSGFHAQVHKHIYHTHTHSHTHYDTYTLYMHKYNKT